MKQFNNDNKEVPMYIYDSFKDKFGDMEFTESNNKLEFKTLTEYTKGSDLGVEPVTLGEVYNYLKNATEEIKDSNWNLFLVKDKDEKLSVAHAYWDSGGRRWDVGAYGLSGEWRDGCRVFSRNITLDVDKIDLIDELTLDKAIAICKKAGLRVIKTITTEIEL